MAQGLQVPDSALGGMPNMPSLPQQFAEAKQDNAAAMQDVEKAKKASSEARLAGKQKIEGIQKEAPAVPDLKPLPDKFEHKGMDDKAMTDAMQTMFVFAALGGAMTRTPMTGAMKAFGGALKGLAQGDQAAFQREGAEFDRNLKVAMQKNNEALSKYKLAFEKHKGDLSSALQEIQLEAAAHNDTVTGAMARANNAKGVMQQIQSMARTEGQMAQVQKRFEFMVQDSQRKHAAQMAKMDLDSQRLAEQMRHNRVGEEGRADALNRRTGDAQNATPPDPRMVKMLADKWRQGDSSALSGLGYGKEGSALRRAVLTQAAVDAGEAGQSGGDLAGQKAGYQADASSLKQYQNYMNRLEALGGKIDKDIDTLFTVAEKGVGPTKMPIIDKWIQMGRKGIGDEDVSKFEIQIQTVKNEYGRAMSGPASNAQLSATAIKHADDLINSAQNLEQLKGVVNVMRQDIKNQSDVANSQIGNIKGRLSGRRSTDAPKEGPKVGEKRTINGQNAEWDGKGWKAAE